MLSKITHWAFLILILPSVIFTSCYTSQSNPIAQFTRDTLAIRNYLSQNKINALKLPSGIWFIVDSSSKGIRATFDDSILVTYSTHLIPNNTVADQSSTPVTFILSSLVSGVQLAMPYFQSGSGGRIFIPSFLGYQSGSQNGIPPNSNLIFQFKLKSVGGYQLEQDTLAISSYLSGHSIRAISDPSGLHYTIDSAGTGVKPQINDYVTLKYLTKIMSNGQTVDQSASTKFMLSSLVMGLQIGLANIKQGSKCTLYVPSSLGYGPFTTNGIAANSNLIFNIQLLNVSSN